MFQFRYFEKSLKEFVPDFIVYNAGTDILEGDPLGKLSITDLVRFFIMLKWIKKW